MTLADAVARLFEFFSVIMLAALMIVSLTLSERSRALGRPDGARPAPAPAGAGTTRRTS
jgi:hypothetical protein